MGPSEWAAARWALSHGEVAGLDSTTLPNAQYRFSPLRTSRGTVGVIGVKPGEETLTDDDHRMLDSLFDQTAIAIERILLVRGFERGTRRGRERALAIRFAVVAVA